MRAHSVVGQAGETVEGIEVQAEGVGLGGERAAVGERVPEDVEDGVRAQWHLRGVCSGVVLHVYRRWVFEYLFCASTASRYELFFLN